MTDSLKRVGLLVHGFFVLRKTPALDRLTRARGAVFARRATVPAGRNIGIAICLLPGPRRHEARAALLACRVLDAFEDLAGSSALRRPALEAAIAYLAGRRGSRPSATHLEADRASEQVDLLLATRIDAVRELVAGLPPDGRQRIEHLVVDVGTVMAQHVADPMPRAEYGRGVLGRATEYACALVTDDELDGSDLCRAVGSLAQLANDLRDGECALYDALTPEELTQQVVLRLLPGAIAAVAVLRELNGRTRSRGARAAIAYTAITTASFLCGAAGAPPPIARRLRAPTAFWMATSTRAFERILRRLEVAANRAVWATLTGDSRRASSTTAPSLFGSRPSGDLAHLLIDAAFHIVDSLPAGRLDGHLPEEHGWAMMLADHLAFSSLEHLTPDGVDDKRQLAELLQRAATPSDPGRPPGPQAVPA